MIQKSFYLFLLAFLGGNHCIHCEGFGLVSKTLVTRAILRHSYSSQLSAEKHPIDDDEYAVSSRRSYLSKMMTTTTIGLLSSVNTSPSNAFDNKISNQYDDRPKRHGPQPKDLGVSTRKDDAGDDYQGLKQCGPAPNCFCSTDKSEIDPDHFVPAWKWPKGVSQMEAFQQLDSVVKQYPPGQGNIDGGGFKIITSDPTKGYMYIQFESLKAGYIDDVEFAVIDAFGQDSVQVRSSSRVGYLDFGVNAKRFKIQRMGCYWSGV
jgi:uncharacterized protein (DUF1499 family)